MCSRGTTTKYILPPLSLDKRLRTPRTAVQSPHVIHQVVILGLKENMDFPAPLCGTQYHASDAGSQRAGSDAIEPVVVGPFRRLGGARGEELDDFAVGLLIVDEFLRVVANADGTDGGVGQDVGVCET